MDREEDDVLDGYAPDDSTEFPEGENPFAGLRVACSSDPLVVSKGELISFKMELNLKHQNFKTLDEANAYVQQFIGRRNIPAKAETPLEKALVQTLMAYDRKQPKTRRNAAQKALEICPDCAQAWVLLAQETDDDAETERLFREGIAAGERALGPKYFQNKRNNPPWAIQARGYLRARAGLMICLWDREESRQATKMGMELLRLNPEDNQGIRTMLASWLVETREYHFLNKILQAYRHDLSPHLRYPETMYLYKTLGDHPKTHRCLEQALRGNQYVPFFLLGHWEVLDYLEERMFKGEESEAADYVYIAGNLWRDNPQALLWLDSVIELELPTPQ